MATGGARQEEADAVLEKTIALLAPSTLEELDRLAPARQRGSAALCHRWWPIASAVLRGSRTCTTPRRP